MIAAGSIGAGRLNLADLATLLELIIGLAVIGIGLSKVFGLAKKIIRPSKWKWSILIWGFYSFIQKNPDVELDEYRITEAIARKSTGRNQCYAMAMYLPQNSENGINSF